MYSTAVFKNKSLSTEFTYKKEKKFFFKNFTKIHLDNLIAINQIMTATVETVSEQLDLAAIMPSEKVVSAVARSVTLSDADVGKLKLLAFFL